MNARALGAWSAACLVVVFSTANPVYRILVLLAALNVLLARALPGRSSRGTLRLIALSALLAALLNTLLSHTGVHVLAVLPGWVPGAGGPMTLEAVAFGADSALALAATMCAAAVLSLALEPDQVLHALPRFLHRTGAAVSASLNLVPGIGRSLTSIREAQAMRGWRARGPASWGEILVPTLLTSMEDSIQLAEAMEARGFGSGPVSRYRPAAWSRLDAVTVVSAAVATAVFGVGRVLGTIPDWYPYPDFQFPQAAALPAAAAILLVAPAIRWRSRPLPV